MVSTDQFEIFKPWRLFGSAGRETLNKKYCGGTIFYDPATKILKVYFQTSLNAAETILSKNKFERFMGKYSINVKHYQTDNGIFTKTKFMEEIESNNQIISSCGVGAHHQNAHAERVLEPFFQPLEPSCYMLFYVGSNKPKQITGLWQLNMPCI